MAPAALKRYLRYLILVASLVLVGAGPHHAVPGATNIQALDEGGEALTVEEVSRPPLSLRFRPVDSLPQTKLYIVRWYRFDVPREDGTQLVLHLQDAVSEADLYYPRVNGSFGVVHFGMNVPFQQREYRVAWPTARLLPEMREGRALYLRTYGPNTTLDVQSAAAYERFRSNLARGTLFFVGFILSLGILSVFFAFYLRDETFAYHALLMLAAAVFMLTVNNLSWEYLWPWTSFDWNVALGAAFLTYLLAFILFTRRFLAVWELRGLDVAIWTFFGLNVVATLIFEPLFPDSNLLAVLVPPLNFGPGILVLVAAVIRLRAGYPQARFFAVGYGGMLVIFIIGGILRAQSQSRWGFNLGVAFDALFFQFAMADRVISANRNRDAAQQAALRAQDALVRSQQEAIEALQRHNQAVGRFVPNQFLRQLGHTEIVDVRLGDHVESDMAILFSDIRSFTALSEQMSPRDSFEFVNAFFARIGPAIRRNGGFIDKYIGDAVMALFGERPDSAVDAAIALQGQVKRFNESRARALKGSVGVGVGIHFGPVMLGTIGEEERLETTVVSDAVNVASRLEGLTRTYGAQIIISGSLVQALEHRSNYRLRSLGSEQLKGLSHVTEIFEVCDADEPELLLQKMASLEAFESALGSFRAGDFAASARLFGAIVDRDPRDRPAEYFRSSAAMKMKT